MRRLSEYQERYETVAMSRSDDGVLEITLHTEGHPSWVFSSKTHAELGAAFHDVAQDRENRVVILTGTGNRFCADIDYASFVNSERFNSAAGWDQVRWDGTRMLANFLDIDVPIVSAINGPVGNHSELPLLADIVLAAEHAAFSDRTHMPSGVPPADGVHVVWPLLLGLNRGRYFLLTGQEISAREALDLGVVNEVLAADALLPRARELAHQLAGHTDLTLQAARRALTLELRRRLSFDVYYGLSIEGLAFVDSMSSSPEGGHPGHFEDLMPNHPR